MMETKVRYTSIDRCECNNGLDIGVSLYLQGCSHECKGCFNPETWDFNKGKEFTEETKQYLLDILNKPYTKRITFTGGDSLEPYNYFELAELINLIKKQYPEVKIWVYTGYTYEILQEMESSSKYLKFILNNIDVLVDGQFQEDKKDLTYPFAGSTNQRIIDMRKTREQNKIVLLDI